MPADRLARQLGYLGLQQRAKSARGMRDLRQRRGKRTGEFGHPVHQNIWPPTLDDPQHVQKARRHFKVGEHTTEEERAVIRSREPLKAEIAQLPLPTINTKSCAERGETGVLTDDRNGSPVANATSWPAAPAARANGTVGGNAPSLAGR